MILTHCKNLPDLLMGSLWLGLGLGEENHLGVTNKVTSNFFFTPNFKREYICCKIQVEARFRL